MTNFPQKTKFEFDKVAVTVLTSVGVFTVFFAMFSILQNLGGN